MQVIVEIKNVYGIEKIYPVGERAEMFAKLAGTKTLTRQAIDIIKKLGCEIIVEQKQVEL